MIAEDNQMIRETVGKILQAEGHEVFATPDGIAALEAIDTEPCDVLVTDMRMPGMDGIELIEKVKADRPHLPVVLMTGDDLTEQAIMDLMSVPGADFVLRKPFTSDALVGAIASAFASVVSRL